MTTKKKPPKLLPCPWCGSPAFMRKTCSALHTTDLFVIGCPERGSKCEMQPERTFLSLKYGVMVWNTRVKVKP